MCTSKLPIRPSLESLRKQAKKLARALLAAMQLPSPGRVLSRLKPSCRCHSVMPSWCSRANMGFQAGRTWLEK